MSWFTYPRNEKCGSSTLKAGEAWVDSSAPTWEVWSCLLLVGTIVFQVCSQLLRTACIPQMWSLVSLTPCRTTLLSMLCYSLVPKTFSSPKLLVYKAIHARTFTWVGHWLPSLLLWKRQRVAINIFFICHYNYIHQLHYPPLLIGMPETLFHLSKIIHSIMWCLHIKSWMHYRKCKQMTECLTIHDR